MTVHGSSSSVPLRLPLLSSGGLLVGVGLGLALTRPTEALLGVMFVLPVIGAAGGAALASAQLLGGLADRVRASLWIAASAAALAIGLTVSTALVEAVGLRPGRVLHDLGALVVVGGGAGASLGAGQWLATPGSRRPGAGALIGGAALGLATGAVAGGALCHLLLGTIRSLPAVAVIAVAGGAGAGVELAGRRPRDGRARDAA